MKAMISMFLFFSYFCANAGDLIIDGNSNKGAIVLQISGRIDLALSDSLTLFTQGYRPVLDTYLVLDNSGEFFAQTPLLKSSIQSLALKVHTLTKKPLKIFVFTNCASACIAVFALVSNIKNDPNFSNTLEIKVSENALFGFRGGLTISRTEEYLSLLERENVSSLWIKKYKDFFSSEKLAVVAAKDLLSQGFHPQLQEMIF